MRVYNRDEFAVHEDIIMKSIANGAVYIHPTDTIYGVGCDATNASAVKRIREAKKQQDQPFSIIAPGKQWIRNNCVVTKEAEAWLDKLPGPYTLVFRLKKQNVVAKEVMPNKETIGVRILNHWIQDIALALNKPLVTTSANVHGKAFMTNLDNLADDIKNKADFAIYEGPKKGRPSTIVDLTNNLKIIPRAGPRVLDKILCKGEIIAEKVRSIGRRITRRLRKN